MKYILPILMSLLVFGCKKQVNELNILTQEENELISDYCSSFPDETQLSIAFIDNDHTSYIGFIKQGDNLIAVNNKDSVFGIGSITKVLTATLAAHLMVDSAISYDEPIEKFLPFKLHPSNYNNSDISFKTLLNHTSGFPRMPTDFIEMMEENENGFEYDAHAFKDYLQNKLDIINKPGEQYCYSNLAYTTLGYLIEHIQNTKYEDLLQQKVCAAYGLKNTTTEYETIKESLVSGRDSSGHRIPHIDYGVYEFSGGIFSSVSDLSKFVQANFTGDSILKYQRQEIYRWGNEGMALGWHVSNFGGANCKWYVHDGGLEGYRSSCFMDVSSKNAVIILSNVSSFHPNSYHIVELAVELMKSQYLKYGEDHRCANSFLQVALKNGWGAHKRDSLLQTNLTSNSLIGVWQQNNGDRIVTRTFFPDNKVQTDFYKDPEIDVWGYYKVNGNEILFTDIGGPACISDGIYEYEIIGDTLRFKEIADDCDGRKYGMINDWIRAKE